MRTEISVRGTKIGVFDDKTILTGQMIRLEDETGWTLTELLEQVQRSSGRGLQALIWFTQVLNGNPTPERFMEFALTDLEIKDLDAEESAGKGDEKPVKAVKAA